MDQKKWINSVRRALEARVVPALVQTDVSHQRFDDSGENAVVLSVTVCGESGLVFFECASGAQKIQAWFEPVMIGGGQSPRVRNALLILAEAIRLDNEDAPQNRSPKEMA